MSHLLPPVDQLRMRLEFMQGVLEIALVCNYSKSKLEGLQRILLEELSYVDNLMYDVYERTGDKALATSVWNASMENLRRWLSLAIGIKIRYV